MKPTYTVPTLSLEEVRAALDGKPLSPMRVNALRKRINQALHSYSVEQLVPSRSATPSQLRKHLSQIERTAASGNSTKAAGLLSNSSLAAARKELKRLAVTRELKEAAVYQDMSALAELARDAGKLIERRMERSAAQAAPGKKREGRNKGNLAMSWLIAKLNSHWVEYFRDLPGVTLGRKDAPGGAYLNFVYSILWAFAERIGSDIEADFPAFKAQLRLSRRAIHGYFRRTGISKFRNLS